ncbi:MAG: hypothetical protein MUE56_05895 [Ignavibacteria bacterium]|nr:hypothetical protein [Ignavibacteria bacterium]
MKKSNFTRSTAERTFADLPQKFHKYLKKYTEIHKIENSDNEVLQCFVTTNLKKRFLGRVKTTYTVICITKQFLFWGIIDDNKDTGIAGAKWEELSEIRDWENSEMGRIVEDSGVEIFGFIYRSSRRSTWFLGLGKDNAGDNCRAVLKEVLIKK